MPLASVTSKDPVVVVPGPAADDELVSVITPAYNVVDYIGEAMRSVLSQTYRNLEYIVVDDGSTDGTVELVRQIAEDDDRVRIVNIEHSGGSTARNRGLQMAKGAYVSFLDGDDRWHDTFLEKNLEMLHSLPDDVAAVFCRPRIISESGRPYLVRWERSGGYDFDGMIAGACPPKCGSTLLIKREAFHDTGGFSDVLDSAVDLDMWLRIQRDSKMGVFWANPAYLMDQRIRAGAISRDHYKRFSALDRILETYAPQMKRLSPATAYIRPAVFAFRSGDEEFATRWSEQGRKAGLRYLATDLYGLRMLIWMRLGAEGRSRLRSASDKVRAVAGRLLGAGRTLAR